jgi:hypothetical protein
LEFHGSPRDPYEFKRLDKIRGRDVYVPEMKREGRSEKKGEGERYGDNVREGNRRGEGRKGVEWREEEEE